MPEAFPHPTRPPLDREAEVLLRVGAWLGDASNKATSLTFTTLLASFLVATDPVSRWFQELSASRGLAQQTTFMNLLRERELAWNRANTSDALPTMHELITVSARGMIAEAAGIAQDMGAAELGTRHFLVAYALRTPKSHVSQLHMWGLAPLIDWQRSLVEFLQQTYRDERWQRWAPLPENGRLDVKVTAPAAELRLDAHVGAVPATSAAGVATGAASSAGEAQLSVPGAPTDVAVDDAPPTALHLIGRYNADDPATAVDDLLSVDDEAAAFARIIAAKAIVPPLAIGVFGAWGAGKSYFMRRIEALVEALRPTSASAERDALFYRHIVQIRFNAWHYIDNNLWASLVEFIFSALDTWIGSQASLDHNAANRVFGRLSTAQQLQVEALVSRALHQQYPDLLQAAPATEEEPYAGASPNDYLEKIFQIPFWVRPMDPKAAMRYVRGLVRPDLDVPPLPPARVDPSQVDPEGLLPALEGLPPISQPLPTTEQHGTPTPAASPVFSMKGLTLTGWEVDTLVAFAPFCGSTPHDAIRFVNVYRLIKTSLSTASHGAFSSEHPGISMDLIIMALLALVNGAPDSADALFLRMARCDPSMSIQDFSASVSPSGGGTWPHAVAILDLARGIQSLLSANAMTVGPFVYLADTVRRYTFAGFSNRKTTVGFQSK